MKKKNIPLEEIKALYESGLSSIDLAKKYNTSKKTILNRLNEAGTVKRSLSCAGRKNNLNVNFFNKIDSEEKSYWLGFLLADGNIQYCGRYKKGRMLRLALQERDKNHLVKYLKSIGSSHKLVPNKKLKSIWAKFTSIIMCKDLEQKGWHGFKRNGDTKILEIIPKTLRIHLVRGLIDGDGWICKQKRQNGNNRWILGFCDLHKNITDWVKCELQKLGAGSSVKTYQSPNDKVWRF